MKREVEKPQGRFSLSDIDPAPASTEPIVAECPPESVLLPRSSAEVGGEYRGGLGRLSVVNGTDTDAIVVLVQDDAGKRAIYVRAHETGVMTSIPVGTYRLQFQLGKRWLAARRFCSVVGTAEFTEPFDFEEVEESAATRYSRFEVTLHPVPEGTAHTTRLAAEDFRLPPAE